MTMLRNLIISIAVTAASAASATDLNNWIHIYYNRNDSTRVISSPLEQIDRVMHYSSCNEQTCDRILIDGIRDTHEHWLEDIQRVVLGSNVPLLSITTSPEVTEVTSKVDYLSGTTTITYYDGTGDFGPTAMQIRGRGNSTWSMAKKPYRLKFSKKQTIDGVRKAKNYCLIANYIDVSHARNTVAFKIAGLLGMEYANHSVPVRVEFNGIDKGLYMLTEKVGINSGSVDIDETQGIILELDTYMDEDYVFYSDTYSLPMMVKDPDFAELAEEDPEGRTDSELFALWRDDFNRAEALVAQGRGLEAFDIQSLSDYMIVFSMMLNQEIQYPKSGYMYKENIDGLYHMGPVWDFDWCGNYNALVGTITSVGGKLFNKNGNHPGNRFFVKLMNTPQFLEFHRSNWQRFYTEQFPLLLEYYDAYTSQIEAAATNDYELWPVNNGQWKYEVGDKSDYRRNVAELRDWLIRRAEYIDKDPNCALF